jgi:GH24 family phage-related lysozyme (muramidase)
MILTRDLIRITRPVFKDITLDHEDVLEACKTVWSQTRDLEANQFTALVSFVLTTPRGTLAKSTVLKLVNDGEITEAANYLESHYYPKSGKHSKKIKQLRKQQGRLLWMGICGGKAVKNGGN